MMRFELSYKPFGASAVLIEWPARIDPEIIQDIISFETFISKDQKVVDTVVAYNSLTVHYRYLNNYANSYKHHKDFSKKVEQLKKQYELDRENQQRKSKVWCIPVCYDLQFGLDLEDVAQQKNLTVENLIALHTQTNYLMYFIGFQPGFLYLGGLDKRLHIPRKANPRLHVEKGSVAIGGEQTGIYPSNSSGGWNIIGKSPINFFDVSKPQPCFAKTGDCIRFQSVSLETYQQILEEVQHGNYQLQSSFL